MGVIFGKSKGGAVEENGASEECDTEELVIK
jgi:hypothetical protein